MSPRVGGLAIVSDAMCTVTASVLSAMTATVAPIRRTARRSNGPQSLAIGVTTKSPARYWTQTSAPSAMASSAPGPDVSGGTATTSVALLTGTTSLALI